MHRRLVRQATDAVVTRRSARLHQARQRSPVEDSGRLAAWSGCRTVEAATRRDPAQRFKRLPGYYGGSASSRREAETQIGSQMAKCGSEVYGR